MINKNFFIKFLNFINKNKSFKFLFLFFLILINIFILTKIFFIFKFLFEILNFIIPMLFISIILFCILNPIVNFLENLGFNRSFSIFLIFLIFIYIFIYYFLIIIPELQNYFLNFFKKMPFYLNIFYKKINKIFNNFYFFKNKIEKIIINNEDLISFLNLIIKNISILIKKYINYSIKFFAKFIIYLFTIPFLVFYFLKDYKKMKINLLKYCPLKFKNIILNILGELNIKLLKYIKSQLLISFYVSLFLIIGFLIIKLKFAIILGILAGILNLIPYIGTIIAFIPIILLSIIGGPILLFKVILILFLEQIIESKIIFPLVLSNQLKIHPITILFLLLICGKIFGIFGFIIGIPLYIFLKIIFKNIIIFYKSF